MNRFVKFRLTLALLFASFMLVSAHTTVNAAVELMNFMSTNGANMESVLTVGDYDFGLFNRTSGWVLNGFYTKEDGVWSKNWLRYKLPVGKSVQMVWSEASNQGACVVPFKLTWDDYDQAEIYNLDWCKGIKNIYLKDNTFTVDYKK